MNRQRELILTSLAGLSVGDALGEMFFSLPMSKVAAREIPDGPWLWTDDTHMALSVVDVLLSSGGIDEDELARLFAGRFSKEPWRGYGGGAQRLLTLYAHGSDWREEAPRLFGGGSYGNGAAMRAAPIGAFFAGDPERAASEAQRSAIVTHSHREGQAGAMAVAAAAAVAASDGPPEGHVYLREVLACVPPTKTREMLETAAGIGAHEYRYAGETLGTGQQLAAFDTVPFCLWAAAHHSEDFEEAIWITIGCWGDIDTTCAIVGGIVSLTSPVPALWLERREPLPEGYSN